MDAFEKLDVWKRSSRLCVTLYQQLKDSKDWGFRDQTTRSALSVPSNIAEGYERNSRKEYVQFLRIAKGSCGELRAQLYIGREAGLLDNSLASTLIEESGEISRMLGSMIGKLRTKDT
jgi:four helix bundle protein